jgi:hypothetical protein
MWGRHADIEPSAAFNLATTSSTSTLDPLTTGSRTLAASGNSSLYHSLEPTFPRYAHFDTLYGQEPFAAVQDIDFLATPLGQGPSDRQPVAPKVKRVAESAESERDILHTQEEADGDGRRKKTRRASSHDVVAGADGNRKFACPYFKRNPKKYRKWTSCPGPGWDEVHRVKYVS